MSSFGQTLHMLKNKSLNNLQPTMEALSSSVGTPSVLIGMLFSKWHRIVAVKIDWGGKNGLTDRLYDFWEECMRQIYVNEADSQREMAGNDAVFVILWVANLPAAQRGQIGYEIARKKLRNWGCCLMRTWETWEIPIGAANSYTERIVNESFGYIIGFSR